MIDSFKLPLLQVVSIAKRQLGLTSLREGNLDIDGWRRTVNDAEAKRGIHLRTVMPRFSVMIPTFHCSETILTTLRSVLACGYDRQEMQIAIVDDGSSENNVREYVSKLDPKGNRIEVYTGLPHLGLAGNWNRAIRLARGELIHLLHQDDYIHKDFYNRLDFAFKAIPNLGMAFCRTRMVDGDNRWLKDTSKERWRAGLLKGWSYRIAVRQRIQTPAVLVARKTYETVGNYSNQLCFSLDWEMWVRIATSHPVWFEPRALAYYRKHQANETSRLNAQGQTWHDLFKTIYINVSRFPQPVRERLLNLSMQWHAHSAIRSATRHIQRGNSWAAFQTSMAAKEFVSAMTKKSARTNWKIHYLDSLLTHRGQDSHAA